MLKDKNIVVGVTGGIAAYKAAELVSTLVKKGAVVDVVMTEGAQEFINPMTMSTLSGRRVHTGLFDTSYKGRAPHICLADRADIVAVVPATANTIGKVANGLADNLLTAVIMATKAPVLFFPAMNVNMYGSPAVQRNLKLLSDWGYIVSETASGRLACGWIGKGRLPGTAEIIEMIKSSLCPLDFQGVRIIVTAGPTREAIDPVRYISNKSSGKMGYSVAMAAAARGAKVVLISGPSALEPPRGVEFVSVLTAEEMMEAVLGRYQDCDVVIKAAAVADYRPKKSAGHKIKKGKDNPVLELEENPDILERLGREKSKQFLVGFAAETEDLERNARKKLIEKNLDMLVANDVTREGAGFDYDTNIVKLLYRDGGAEQLPKMSKPAVANCILDRILDLRKDGQ